MERYNMRDLVVTTEKITSLQFSGKENTNKKYICIRPYAEIEEIEELNDALALAVENPDELVMVKGTLYIKEINNNKNLHLISPMDESVYDADIKEDMESTIASPEYKFIVMNYNIRIQSLNLDNLEDLSVLIVKRKVSENQLKEIKSKKNISAVKTYLKKNDLI